MDGISTLFDYHMRESVIFSTMICSFHCEVIISMLKLMHFKFVNESVVSGSNLCFTEEFQKVGQIVLYWDIQYEGTPFQLHRTE